jgi:predicted GNAT family N-acyltransferase
MQCRHARTAPLPPPHPPAKTAAMTSLTILPVPVFSTLCNAAFALRREVFVLEQNVPEDEENDAYDLTATHFVAIEAGEVVGALRLIILPEHVKIGRVAVRRSSRGRGIAKALIAHAMDHARILGHKRFYLTAQSDKLGFYEALGFAAFGPEFQDGGMPHRAMRDYDKESARLAD